MKLVMIPKNKMLSANIKWHHGNNGWVNEMNNCLKLPRKIYSELKSVRNGI